MKFERLKIFFKNFFKIKSRTKKGVLLDYNYYYDVSFVDRIKCIDFTIQLSNGKTVKYYIFDTKKVFGVPVQYCEVVFKPVLFSVFGAELEYIFIIEKE
ncbi:MAG: hypothetical protein LBQ13_00775 [Endomicrobium sp.]|jgi:hypothetical protein|nr:hypothetical protein [Endomicrobium sp.]